MLGIYEEPAATGDLPLTLPGYGAKPIMVHEWSS